MTARPWVLADTPWKVVRETAYEVAILPWGATEAHNLHLPYGTDIIESEAVAAESARRAWEAGARVVALPAVPFGVNTTQLDIPLTINMNPSTQLAVLDDITDALERQAIPKLLILNGHGGNDFRQMIRELQALHPGLFLCAINWWQVVDARAHFDEPGDHAGELETSLMLHLTPERVLPQKDWGDGATRGWRLRGLREGWAWAPRQWTQVTADTGTGNPGGASAEKGARFFEAVTAKIGSFLVELAALDPADAYE
jgi:creatinine amidohydrolase